MEKPLAGSNPMLHFQIRTPSTGVRPSTTLFHGLIGRISATQSSRFPIGASMPVSPTRAQARSAESVDQADNERHERPDCATRNQPASRAAPCRRPYRPGCRAESPDPLTRARAHADAVRENAPGCHQPIVVHRRWRHTRTGRRRQRRRPARIPTPCSPRFPVNDRTPGTAQGCVRRSAFARVTCVTPARAMAFATWLEPSSEGPSPRSRPHDAGGTAAVKVGEHAVQARRSASPLVVEPGSGPRARNSRPT